MNMVTLHTMPTEVDITVSEDGMPLPHFLKESINSYWDSLIENGKPFHRGEVFSIKELTETKNELRVTLQRTDFAHFIYDKHFDLPEEFNCRVIVANALILTNDNHFVLGQMNSRTANPGRVQFIAGGIDASDVKGNRVDIMGCLIRETSEEVGIDLHDRTLVWNIDPLYIVHWGNIALVYLIKLKIDSSEFQAHYEKFESSLREKEMTPVFSSIQLLSAEPESVSDFLEHDDRPRVDFLGAVLKKAIETV
ncbi:NUDIX hydrolase [Rossellomorea sp. NS-SX7]|uniref:NUDIX hydrolase n=1 Tax=Rossellomorea sp. NS-SX7 TaxID=3463856 RepID=UPI004058AB32